MPADDQKFENALKTFETQVGEATQYWFAAATMNEVARLDSNTLAALNRTPSFWITARVAMENQAILTAGILYGRRRANPHNIDSLFEVFRAVRAAVFSRDALAARKRQMSDNADEWLPEFMKGVHVPTATDIDRLHQPSKRHRKTYETQYADVRNLHVAHSAVADPNVRLGHPSEDENPRLCEADHFSKPTSGRAAAELTGIESRVCGLILGALADARFLRQHGHGVYVHRSAESLDA
jgi:hypothetical protein